MWLLYIDLIATESNIRFECLPVPPTLRFPTAITGKSKDTILNPCIEKKFRILVIKPYKMENKQ
jgi:hypothetical protein